MNLNYSIFSYLIPDNTFVHLFDNIDDRIQLIDEYEHEEFIIIHRVSDNWIFKSMMTNKNY